MKSGSMGDQKKYTPEDDSPQEEETNAVLAAINAASASEAEKQVVVREMKRAAADLIKRYYFQLKDGCGNPRCDNPLCASSGMIGPLTNDEAAVRALQLFSEHANTCKDTDAKVLSDEHDLSTEDLPNYMAKFPREPSHDIDTAMDLSIGGGGTLGASSSNSSSGKSIVDENNFLTLQKLKATISECKEIGHYASLRILLRTVFSNELILKHSFLKQPGKSNERKCESDKTKDGSDTINSDIKLLTIKKEIICKEDIRAAECDLDKDVDCLEEVPPCEDKEMMDLEETKSGEARQDLESACSSDESSSFKPSLDIEELRSAYKCLFQCPEAEFSSSFMDTIRQLLKDSLSIQCRVFPQKFTSDPDIVNVFIIILENPVLTSTDYTEEVLGELCWVMSKLSVTQQVSIVKHLSTQWEASRIHSFLESLHQLITIRILGTQFTRDFTINDDDTITSATQVMKIIYYASIYGGELDLPLLIDLPPRDNTLPPVHQDHFLGAGKEALERLPPWDSLGEALRVHPLDARIPLIPLEDFYDDFLSDQLEMDRDFAYYTAGSTDKFSFLSYPFILTPATKSLGLYYDNRIRMYSERRMSIYQTFLEGQPANPYLTLRIRRDHIIDDALVELELVALDNPVDLKKQLVIEFENEQGIDEGGVSKEFFQLIVEQIFNPDYAMFVLNHETETFWFNPTSFESDAQFTLVGIILGLAIYNNIILDVHFPPVLYKKLCGKPGSFNDLQEWNKTLHKSLLDLRNYEGDDMEDVFVQSFRIGYEDIFGTSLHHDLLPEGSNILVNQKNKEEFVTLYSDFLLNESVKRQFIAFKRGFAMVTDDSPLQHLFRTEELVLLVCGSQNYDFAELRKSTEYDGGYSTSTPIISWFWDLVDQLTTEDKKQLLQFTTGSARVPVGGLARLKLIIARHGPDTARLPTAHTCFNVLLLPEYSSKEKLKERLLKAIKYAQGFGML